MTDKPTPDQILDTIRLAVHDAMPYRGEILDALRPEPAWTILPPGSHLAFHNTDGTTDRGPDLIAMRHDGVVGDALTDEGRRVPLGSHLSIVVGDGKRRGPRKAKR